MRKKTFPILSITNGYCCCTQTIQVVTNKDYPRHNYMENGQLRGFSTEVVKDVVQKVGIKAEFRAYVHTQSFSFPE